MKKLLLAAVMLFGAAGALAGPNDIAFMQRNPTDTGYITRIPATPTDGSSTLFMFNGSNKQAGYARLGAGLAYDGVTLSAIGATGATGPAGAKGDTGATGATGPAGRDGAPASQAWADITGKPTTLTGYGITDGVVASQLTGYATTAQLAGYATSAQLASGLAGKFNTPTGTTAQYVRGDGSLATLPSGAAPSPFNFSQPVARTLAAATSYQAADPTRAAIVTVSASCVNATTVLASSACTLQVRQSAAPLTCGTGVVAMTWTSTVQLGLVFTQTSGSPMEVKLPIGGYFILCPTAGTFTITTAVEQSAG